MFLVLMNQYFLYWVSCQKSIIDFYNGVLMIAFCVLIQNKYYV